MMTLLIPFWAWIILGLIIGWKIRGYFGSKLSFIGKISKPFKAKKKKKKPLQSILDDSDDSDEPEEEEKEN